MQPLWYLIRIHPADCMRPANGFWHQGGVGDCPNTFFYFLVRAIASFFFRDVQVVFHWWQNTPTKAPSQSPPIARHIECAKQQTVPDLMFKWWMQQLQSAGIGPLEERSDRFCGTFSFFFSTTRLTIWGPSLGTERADAEDWPLSTSQVWVRTRIIPWAYLASSPSIHGPQKKVWTLDILRVD